MRKHVPIVLLILLIGCAPQPINTPSFTPTPLTPTSLPSTAGEAYDVLVNFLTLLHTKNYTEAVPLYGGEYEDSYIFQVEFSNLDGSLFVLGPCCGANETEMPPVSQFEYTVSRNADHRFVVMNTPPYVP